MQKEPEEIEEFQRENRVLRNVQVVAGRVSALMNPVTYIIINGGLMALIYVGALQIEGGILSLGTGCGTHQLYVPDSGRTD